MDTSDPFYFTKMELFNSLKHLDAMLDLITENEHAVISLGVIAEQALAARTLVESLQAQMEAFVTKEALDTELQSELQKKLSISGGGVAGEVILLETPTDPQAAVRKESLDALVLSVNHALDGINTRLTQLSETSDTLSGSLGSVQLVVSGLSARLDEDDAEDDSVVLEIAALKEAMTEVNAALGLAATQIQANALSLGEVQEGVLLHAQRLTTLSDALEVTSTVANEAKSTSQDNALRLTNVEEDLSELQQAQASQAADLLLVKQDVADTQQQVDDLTQILNTHTPHLATLDQELATLQSTAVLLNAAIGDASTVNTVQSQQLAQLQYDVAALQSQSPGEGASYAVTPGTYVAMVPQPTPIGYLMANGGDASVGAFPALYAVVGHTFSDRTNIGYGLPWKYQSTFNLKSLPYMASGGWTNTNGPWTSLCGSGLVFTTKTLYSLGGYGGGWVANMIQQTAISDEGVPAQYTNPNALPIGFAYGACAVTNSRAYLACGLNTPTSFNLKIYSADIAENGTLGTSWTERLACHAAAYPGFLIHRNILFIVGGIGSGNTYLDSIIGYKINQDGSVTPAGSFRNLPTACARHKCVVHKNFMYVIGGQQAGSTYRNNVHMATINADGTLSAWQNLTPLPVRIAGFEVCVLDKYIYVFGGYGTNGNNTKIYMADIRTDGTLGAWVVVGELPAYMVDASLAIVRNNILLFNTLNASNNSVVSRSLKYAIDSGSNDYTAYTTGYTEVVASGYFKLPNLTPLNSPNVTYFIKY